MEELFLEHQPEYYDVIPEFNGIGRLCNYHTGEGETVRVMAEEWERFNQLAGRQHEIVGGLVIYNPNLLPCMPDSTEPPDPLAELESLIIDQEYRLILLELGVA